MESQYTLKEISEKCVYEANWDLKDKLEEIGKEKYHLFQVKRNRWSMVFSSEDDTCNYIHKKLIELISAKLHTTKLESKIVRYKDRKRFIRFRNLDRSDYYDHSGCYIFTVKYGTFVCVISEKTWSKLEEMY